MSCSSPLTTKCATTDPIPCLPAHPHPRARSSLCFSFARATRSVSLVPVAYYADIVAAKARSFVTDDDASTVASGASRAKARDPKFIQDKLDRVMKGQLGEMPLGQGMWFI